MAGLSQEEIDWYTEAEKRKLLNDEEQGWWSEAKRRGLTGNAEKSSAQQDEDLRSSVLGGVDNLVKGIGLGTLKTAKGLNQLIGYEPGKEWLNQKIAQGEKSITPGSIPGAVGEFGGEVASNPLSYTPVRAVEKILSPIPALAKSTFAKLGTTSAAQSLLTPASDEAIDENGLAQEKLKQAGLAFGVGGAAGKAFQSIINPQVSDQVKRLLDLGVERLSPAQLMHDVPYLGKAANWAEDKLASTFTLGGFPSALRSHTGKEFVGAVLNDVRDTAEVAHLPSSMIEKGDVTQMLKSTENSISKGYQQIIPAVEFNEGNKFIEKMFGYNKPESGLVAYGSRGGTGKGEYVPGELSSDYNRLTENAQKQFNNIINKNFLDAIPRNPATGKTFSLPGEKFQTMMSTLKDDAQSLYRAGGEQREVGLLLRKFIAKAHENLTLNEAKIGQTGLFDSAFAQRKLKVLNEAWAKYNQVLSAAERAVNKGGVFNPMDLAKQTATGSNKAIRNQGLFGDLASQAGEVIQKQPPFAGALPNINLSQTIDKVMGKKGQTVTEAAIASLIPWKIALGNIGLGSIYNRPVAKATTKLAAGEYPWQEQLRKMGLGSYEAQRAAAVGASDLINDAQEQR